MDRVSSGVPGLDPLLGGGFLPGSFTLVSGSSGTGKTILAFQFVYAGAKEGEPGVFISLEERPETIIRNMLSIGLTDVNELVKKKRLAIVKTGVFNFSEFKEGIKSLVKKNGATRLVIDSVSVLSLFFETSFQVRTGIAELVNFLRELGCTTILTGEIPPGSAAYSTYGVEEYVVDGIIKLFHQMVGNMFVRAIAVIKMRGSKHAELVHPVRITSRGMRIFPEEALPEKFL